MKFGLNSKPNYNVLYCFVDSWNWWFIVDILCVFLVEIDGVMLAVYMIAKFGIKNQLTN